MSPNDELPRWLDLGLLPLLNLALALGLAGVVVAGVGFAPGQVLALLLQGAFGSAAGLGYTLYYATTFVCTGLAVALALHAGQFNIGGEGQALMGGLGAGLVALATGDALPAWALLPLMVAGAALAGALWGGVPGALQAWRGSHMVVTTIMFNFLAAALLSYLLAYPLRAAGSMSPESRAFVANALMPGVHQLLGAVGITWPRTPLNGTLFIALAAALGVWVLLWRTRAGHALRAVGHAPEAALYAGLRPRHVVLWAMAASGALAGLAGVNEVAGAHGRLLPDFVAGAGFAGIAVCLIGRRHPAGIVLAALLFGALSQGGAELSFELPGFSRDMVLLLQGLIVLFAGVLGPVAAPWLARAWRSTRRGSRDG